MSRGDLQNTREYAVTVLFQLSGIPKTLLNNFTCGELKELALEALKLKDDNKKFKLFKQKLDETNMPEEVVKAFYTGDASHDMYIGEVVEIIK